MSLQFWLTSLIVVLTPGTGVVYTMATGITHGFRPSIVAALGCTLGIVPHMLASITGLAALLNASSTAFAVLRYAGVAYLLYMAVRMLRDRSALTMDEETAPRSASKTITSGILLNLLNPKLTLFFFAFLPQFVSAEEPHAFLRMLALSGVFMLLTFVVFVAYGKFAALVRRRVIDRPRILTGIRRTFAAGFVALATSLAFTPA
ncbi:LysE family translocator [Nocardia sp. BMG51109]|uniref:LysE family translocator n=1 Tax=Nocardia sp. BMG51109 TaxID=1056816 RepID=UPI000466539C|nr:LysE family translocator [Nocardia sp. BMG51109]